MSESLPTTPLDARKPTTLSAFEKKKSISGAISASRRDSERAPRAEGTPCTVIHDGSARRATEKTRTQRTRSWPGEDWREL